MLAGLGRWMRAAGYDTALAKRGMNDDGLIAIARREGRLLITRDQPLAARMGTAGAVALLQGTGLAENARELRERVGFDWLFAPFTRCLLDNALLRPAGAAELDRVPPKARGLSGPVRVCPDCRRVYWPGSHHRRMQGVLERWQGAGPATAVSSEKG
jgi:hypothetical protein